MNRKKKTISVTETLADLVALAPWWVGCLLALVGYAFLHYLATQFSTAPDSVSGASIWATLAGVGQYAVPLICLLLAGISYWHRHRAIELMAPPVVRKSAPGPTLDGMTLINLELLLSESFRLQDFTVTEIGAASAMDGADITLKKNEQTFLVQCKHWEDEQITLEAMSEFQELIARKRASGGFVVTAGSFTSEAQAFAERANLTLLDGRALQGMIEQTQASRLSCPNCGKPMLRRSASLGSACDTAFWACTDSPVCQGTRPVLPPLS